MICMEIANPQVLNSKWPRQMALTNCNVCNILQLYRRTVKVYFFNNRIVQIRHNTECSLLGGKTMTHFHRAIHSESFHWWTIFIGIVKSALFYFVCWGKCYLGLICPQPAPPPLSLWSIYMIYFGGSFRIPYHSRFSKGTYFKNEHTLTK